MVTAAGPVPDDVVRPIQAVTSVLPGQTRRGATPVPDARLAVLALGPAEKRAAWE